MCNGLRIGWQGEGLEEKGLDVATGKAIVAVDSRYFRPAEVDTLLGDATKARQQLGWEPQVTFEKLVEEMVEPISRKPNATPSACRRVSEPSTTTRRDPRADSKKGCAFIRFRITWVTLPGAFRVGQSAVTVRFHHGGGRFRPNSPRAENTLDPRPREWT